jgi:hypothetical protein
VVGIGVAGSSSKSLAAACDDFVIYDALPGVPAIAAAPAEDPAPRKRAPARVATGSGSAEPEPPEPGEPDPQAAATALLTRALQIGQDKDDDEWLHNSTVKAQMKRMDPSFSEKSLGFRSFSDFLRSRTDVVELDETSTTRLVKLR